MTWKMRDLPDQHGKTVVVTGGNSGIGFQAARALAQRGAHVVLACRSLDKGAEARARIEADATDGSASVLALDLADLGSVRSFAEAFSQEHDKLDLLVNNAGVMFLPRSTTADGFEMHLGVNHLGHFALTGLLLDQLLAADNPRVVTVSSMQHRVGWLDFGDLMWSQSYNKLFAYGRSKLANLLFAYELQRRGAPHGLTSTACHPGYADTRLHAQGPDASGSVAAKGFFVTAAKVFAQPSSWGAEPTLRAATATDVGETPYFGPALAVWGHARRQRSNRMSRDRALASRLWEVSQELTGVAFTALE